MALNVSTEDAVAASVPRVDGRTPSCKCKRSYQSLASVGQDEE